MRSFLCEFLLSPIFWLIFKNPIQNSSSSFPAPHKVGLIALHKMKIYCSSESRPHCAPQNKNLLLLRVGLLAHHKLKCTDHHKVGFIALHKIKIYCCFFNSNSPHTHIIPACKIICIHPKSTSFELLFELLLCKFSLFLLFFGLFFKNLIQNSSSSSPHSHLLISTSKMKIYCSSESGPHCTPFNVLKFFKISNPDNSPEPSLLLGHAL